MSMNDKTGFPRSPYPLIEDLRELVGVLQVSAAVPGCEDPLVLHRMLVELAGPTVFDQTAEALGFVDYPAGPASYPGSA